jgi:hypothetical protein
MRILIPQICVASGLLEIFQKMQLRGRRNGHKHRVVGSSHRKGKKKEAAAAGDTSSSSCSSSRPAATTTTRATSDTLQRRKPKAELGLGFR